jgi:hypothetical protein
MLFNLHARHFTRPGWTNAVQPKLKNGRQMEKEDGNRPTRRIGPIRPIYPIHRLAHLSPFPARQELCLI